MNLCPKHQDLYEGWLVAKPAPWRGMCYRCLDTGGTLCRKCCESQDQHRKQQRDFTRQQLDDIRALCGAGINCNRDTK